MVCEGRAGELIPCQAKRKGSSLRLFSGNRRLCMKLW